MVVGVYGGKPSEDGGVKQDTTALEWLSSRQGLNHHERSDEDGFVGDIGDFRGGVLELRPRDAKVRRRVRVHFARALARCRVVPRETVFRRTRQRLAPGDEGGLVVLPGERRRQ